MNKYKESVDGLLVDSVLSDLVSVAYYLRYMVQSPVTSISPVTQCHKI